MADTTPKEEGIVRTISDAPPSHYVVKIQSVSLLKNNIDQYVSDAFDAGGYKWKLVVHPSGNKNKKVTDHISLYIKLADTSNLHPGWEVHAVIRMFLYDQKKDNYYVVQDAEEKTRRFRAMKVEWGHDRFIPLTEFYNASNGYWVDDVCVFGVEIYAEFTVRIVDQSNPNNHISLSDKCWFNATNAAYGWPKFISIDEFRKPEGGYLVKESCRVEADIKVLGVAEPDDVMPNNSAYECKEITLT
nr:E3 ubiquitin-protein ligase SIN-like [Ipomoea batatas]